MEDKKRENKYSNQVVSVLLWAEHDILAVTQNTANYHWEAWTDAVTSWGKGPPRPSNSSSPPFLSQPALQSYNSVETTGRPPEHCFHSLARKYVQSASSKWKESKQNFFFLLACLQQHIGSRRSRKSYHIINAPQGTIAGIICVTELECRHATHWPFVFVCLETY